MLVFALRKVGISVLRNTKPFFRQGKIDKKGKDH